MISIRTVAESQNVAPSSTQHQGYFSMGETYKCNSAILILFKRQIRFWVTDTFGVLFQVCFISEDSLFKIFFLLIGLSYPEVRIVW